VGLYIKGEKMRISINDRFMLMDLGFQYFIGIPLMVIDKIKEGTIIESIDTEFYYHFMRGWDAVLRGICL